MTAYTDFLANPDAVSRSANWVVTLYPTLAGVEVPIYAAMRQGGFRTTTADYQPRIRQLPTLTHSLWAGDSPEPGSSSLTVGDLVLDNADGGLDAYAPRNGYTWEGARAVIQFGSGVGNPRATDYMALTDFGTIFNGLMGDPSFGLAEVTVPLKSYGASFDQPLQRRVYRGTSGSLYLPATGYASAGVPAARNITGDITVEMWVQFEGTWAAARIVYFWPSATRFPWRIETSASGQIAFRYTYSTGTVDVKTSTAALTIGKWYHLAIIVSGTAGQFVIYDEATSTETLETFTTLAATRDANSGGTATRLSNVTTGLQGRVDDIRLWNTARTLAEIRENRNAPLDTVPAACVTYFTCDDMTGTTLTDSSATADNATLTGSTEWHWANEGDGSLAGKIKPSGWGTKHFIRPVLVDPVRQVYQVATGPLTSISGVAEGLLWLTSDGDITSERTFNNTTPAAGHFQTHLARGLIKLDGIAPTYAISCHFVGETTAADTKMSTIMAAIAVNRAGISDPSSETDWTAAASAFTANCGFWTDQAITCRQAMDILARSGRYSWGYDRGSAIPYLRPFSGAAGTADYDFTINEIVSVEPISTRLAAQRVEILFSMASLHTLAEIAPGAYAFVDRISRVTGDIADASGAWLRRSSGEGTSGRIVTFKTALSFGARGTAAQQAQWWYDYLSGGLEMVKAKIASPAYQVVAGDTVSLAVTPPGGSARLGLDSTRLFVVIETKDDGTTVELTLLG